MQPPLHEEAFELSVFKTNQPSVEQKMAEQLEEFESQMNALGISARNGSRSSSAPPASAGAKASLNGAASGATRGDCATSSSGAAGQSERRGGITIESNNHFFL